MKIMKIGTRLTFLSAFILAMAGPTSSALASGHGVWNTQVCEIKGNDYNSTNLDEALQLNNKSLNRGCTWLISFIDHGSMALDHQIVIEGNPVHNNFGTMFSVPGDVDFTLDATGLGDCPIKVTTTEQGVLPKIDMQKIKIKADNINKAICDASDNALYPGIDANGHVIPQDDGQKDYIYIYPTVTIVPAVPQPGNPDIDNDGWCTPGQTGPNCSGSDNCPEIYNPDQANFDGGALGDACDPDDDNDGICDGPDAATTSTEGDCLAGPDQCPRTEAGESVNDSGCGPRDDQDGDGIPNDQDLCDADTPGGGQPPVGADNTCSRDFVAGCSQTQDMDGDGLGDACDGDIDGDTLPNGSDPDPYDKDADNDGVNDNLDQCPLNNLRIVTPCNSIPPPLADADPDRDGLTTTLENDVLHTNPNVADTDGDGYMDGVDCFPLDPTKQVCGGTIVVLDPDSDNDGICDSAISVNDPVTGAPCTPNALGNGDNCPLVSNPDQADSDKDGIGDACEFTIDESVDGDGDGLPDDLEVSVFGTDPTKFDTDGDGLSDGEEVDGPTYQGGSGPLNPDVDFDGICDGPATVSDLDGSEICNAGPLGTGDNCPIIENPGQEDGNDDGAGDVCQDDLDGDGVPDLQDNCPFMKNKHQEDTDRDGIGDKCDITVSASGLGPEGCGCRIDGKSQGRAGDLLPFLAMILPMLMFRIVRRREEY